MRLITIKQLPEPEVKQFLWNMLKDREPVVNISHQGMPSWNQHCDFVDSCPYRDWLIIEHNATWIGQIYLTHANEIGIFMMKGWKGQGYGKEAINRLVKYYGPGRFLANIAPNNTGSQQFFECIGFKRVQLTYEFEVKETENEPDIFSGQKIGNVSMVPEKCAQEQVLPTDPGVQNDPQITAAQCDPSSPS